ncbi:MAG: hypothetical protein WEF86_11710 [Gemmatimonadota bacterium]
MRRALGASTLRMLQHHTAQGIVVAGAGAALGVGLAFLLLRGAAGLAVSRLPLDAVQVDVRVLGFAAAASRSAASAAGPSPACSTDA